MTKASILNFKADGIQKITTDSNNHTIYQLDGFNDHAYIKDTITYDGLTVENTYLVESQLVDKDTGEIIGGENNTVKSRLMPTSSNGTYDVVFNKVNLYGQSLYKEDTNKDFPFYRNIVVYQTITDISTGKVVLRHTDQNSEDQTVRLRAKNVRADKASRTHLANTGGYAGFFLPEIFVLGCIYLRAKRKSKKHNRCELLGH